MGEISYRKRLVQRHIWLRL